MSKIYEALLQAELDRLTPEEQATYERDPASLPNIASILARSSEVDAMSSEASVVTAHNRAPRFLEVAQRTWQPDVKKLPTLQSRSAFTEQFRSLRSRLYEYRGFHKLKTVLVRQRHAQRRQDVRCREPCTQSGAIQEQPRIAD